MHVEPFRFIEPGPLIDGELELVEPAARWVDGLMASIRHPLTQRDFPSERTITRDSLLSFVERYPRGRQPAEHGRNIVPAYHFWMRLRPGWAQPVPFAGGLGLRVGSNPHILLYAGHIGYHVYPPVRGRHYAERACRLVLPLARCHGFRELWITANPDNIASRRTCERLGAQLVEIVPIPPDDPLYTRGERHKCRYRLPL